MAAGIDPGQLGLWFEAYSRPLALYARQWLPNGTAEDVVQDAFLRLMRQRQVPNNVKAWLFTTVRHACISELRRDQRQRARHRRRADQTPAWFESRPDDRLDAQHAQVLLQELPIEQREVVALRIWGQLTLQEIARIVGVSVSTVHHRYQNTLQTMRERMDKPCKTKQD